MLYLSFCKLLAVTAFVEFWEVWTPFILTPSKFFVWRSTVTEMLCLRAAKAALTAY